MADELPEFFDTWVTWTTMFTGVPQAEHGMKFLEQPPETIHARRLWDLADDGGLGVGVYGSVCSWPPHAVKGFFVPGSFSPDTATYPDELRPIQELNLRYTRAHTPGVKPRDVTSVVTTGLRLIRFGLSVRTVLGVLKVLAEVKARPDRSWKKVSLQPVINMAFFKNLWKRYKPDFATFHTNHLAHYQRRFLRAMSPEHFPDATDPKEVERFGAAVGYGDLTADKLLGELLDLCARERDVVLCVASSMGQKPFIPERYGKVAPVTCRIRSIESLLEVLRIEGRCRYFSTMAPQWNITNEDEELMGVVIHHLRAARYQPLGKAMYSAVQGKESIVVTPLSHHGLNSETRCTFPTLEGSPILPFDELVVQADETRKSGCHDPIGMIGFYGSAVRHGIRFDDVNNLDVAPTLMTLLGLPVPDFMKGRVIHEAFGWKAPIPRSVGAI